MSDMSIQESLPVASLPEMTPEEKKKASMIASSIDIYDNGQVSSLGKEQQASTTQYADKILNGALTNEIGAADKVISKVLDKLKKFDQECTPPSSKGFFSIFKKKQTDVSTLRRDYASLMQEIASELREKKLQLDKDADNLQTMYNKNVELYRILSIIVAAAEIALEREKKNLENLRKNSDDSHFIKDQRISGLEDGINLLERRINDLKISKMIALQQAPMIAENRDNMIKVSNSIDSTLVETLPLWKSQIAISLGIKEVRDGLDSVHSVGEATNRLIIKNSELSRQMVIETMEATKKGLVDTETLGTVNKELIEALTKCASITQETIEARTQNADELRRREAQLKYDN